MAISTCYVNGSEIGESHQITYFMAKDNFHIEAPSLQSIRCHAHDENMLTHCWLMLAHWPALRMSVVNVNKYTNTYHNWVRLKMGDSTLNDQFKWNIMFEHEACADELENAPAGKKRFLPKFLLFLVRVCGNVGRITVGNASQFVLVSYNHQTPT